MTTRAPNARLLATTDGPVALLDPRRQARTRPLEALELHVLETLLHEPEATGDALAAAVRARMTSPSTDQGRFGRARAAVAAGAVVLVSSSGLRVLVEGGVAAEGVITLTRKSREGRNLLAALYGLDPPATGDAATCERAVDALRDLGLVVPALGRVDWGDLRRRQPIDEVFGFGRGTPVDRYYLRAFVDDVRHHMQGDVVDIGGRRDDRLTFGLRDVASFAIVDLEPRTGVDVVGDVHDPDVLEPACADTVLLFNVLEHCHDPHRVAANVHRWLRPGGRCFVMVPNAQRLHGAPDDLWRFSEAGLARVFAGYASVETRSYGNLTTVLASHLGLATEELTADELDLHQPDHPVATCAVATKAVSG